MHVLAFTRYQRLGSSSRVRFYQYFPYLESMGVQIVHVPFFDDEYVRNLYTGRSASLSNILKAYNERLITLTRTRRNRFDLLWVEKELLPWFPAKIESLFRSHGIPYIVDYDDAVFHRYDLHSNVLIRAMLGNKIDRVMQQATLVIVGNEYLAKRARKAGTNRVEILPSVVDVSQYALKQPDTSSAFKIGWIGSPITARYLSIVRDVMAELSKESNVRLVLVGAGSNVPLHDLSIEVLPWNEEIELTVNQRFDVGIMPLIDGPFERGKCGYKLVQYMAGGIPVVASSVGVNQQIVEHNINGFLANTTEEWLAALRILRDNDQKRIELGKAGRKKAEAEYNLQVTAPKLLDLLKSIAST